MDSDTGSSAKRLIHVLLLGESEQDASLIRKELERADFEVDLERVPNLVALRTSSSRGSWDIVLCDHDLPAFDFPETLRTVREHLPDTPVIVLAGSSAEESAISAMKAGAQDYLLKENLARLVPVVERELREMGERRERRGLEKAVIAQLQEFRIGREIQQRLFPAAAPLVPGFDIAGASWPAAATGGDYFDFIRVKDGSVVVVVGDVAGHGIGPALLMADVRACLRALFQMCDDPADVLYRANQLLLEDLGTEHFVTLVLAKLDPGQRRLSYVNAGHTVCYVLGGDGCVREELAATVPALGLFPFQEQPRSSVVPLHFEDLILLFTDGLIEATSPTGEEFGVSRVLEVAHSRKEQKAEAIVEALRSAVQKFRKQEAQQDDITVVVIRTLPA